MVDAVMFWSPRAASLLSRRTAMHGRQKRCFSPCGAQTSCLWLHLIYRNIKDYATIDELGVEVHFVKENEIISHSSRSNEQLVQGFKVLMARNHFQNLGEEAGKGMTEKACAGIYPSAPR
jgi:hypothetical protein